MQIEFISKNKNTFTLGTVSFNWLDKNNIFDNYQQDNDIQSKCIFKNDGNNIRQLAIDIYICARKDKNVRKDIQEKLIKFSKFIKNSNGVDAYIK